MTHRFMREDVYKVEGCLTRQSACAALVAWVFSAVCGFWRAALASFSEKKPGESAAAARERVNQRAEHILCEHGNAILRLAYSYLHNMSDAEEILQETLIRFLKSDPQFENVSHEKAWLLHVAGNLSKNRIEYNKIRSTDELNETLVAENREDLSFVWNAVKQLPVKYREVIHLFYQEGYPTEQIARILGKKEATVRTNLHRGRLQLKKILKEAYDFDGTV